MNFFRAINRRRKKATRDRECRLRKSKSLAQTTPRTTIFSSILFPLGQHKYILLVQHIHCFQSKMYTKSQSTRTRDLLGSCKVTQSDLALDFSPRSHSCIWYITRLHSSISQLHLITLLQSSISDNLQGIRKRTDKELCKLKMHVIHEVVMCKNLYYFYWVKQSRTT